MSQKKKKQFSKITKTPRELLREKLPYLNSNQVRRARLPLHEALLAELNEAHFHSSVELFNSLIGIDIQGQKRELVRDKRLLESIYNALVEMETTSTPRLQLLLQLSNRLALDQEACPVWVVEEIYKQALKAMSTPALERHEDTSVRISILFSYGKWLGDKKHDRLDEAICHLSNALKCCTDEIDLQNQITEALCEALKAQSVRAASPLRALKLAQKALNYALKQPNAISAKLNVEIKIQIARCCMQLKQAESAQIILEKTFTLTETAQLFELGFEILKLQIELGGCMANNTSDDCVLKLLKLAQQHAEVKCKAKSMAQAEILILHGRFFARKQIYSEALESFEKAVKIYERENQMKRVCEVSFMMALPKVEQNFNFLIDTILLSDKMRMGQNTALEALIRYVDQKTSLEEVKF